MAWIVFPLVLALLSLGCGLLLWQLTDVRVAGPLLIPVGFAVVIVAASLATMSRTTAQLATPAVVTLAVAGYGLAGRRLTGRPDSWAAVAAVGAFAAYAAPIVLSGSATFAGYITLEDTATWFALADNAMTHGRSVAGLAPS